MKVSVSFRNETAWLTQRAITELFGGSSIRDGPCEDVVMTKTCFVTVAVRSLKPGVLDRNAELGEFHAVWKNGISIGSDPACTIVLPDLPPAAVRVRAASNHKLLYRLPAGTVLPLPPLSPQLGQYGQRVDYGEFEVGPYKIRLGEVYREESAHGD